MQNYEPLEIYLLAHDWFKGIMWPNILQLKVGDIQRMILLFQNLIQEERVFYGSYIRKQTYFFVH